MAVPAMEELALTLGLPETVLAISFAAALSRLISAGFLISVLRFSIAQADHNYIWSIRSSICGGN